MGVPWPSQSRRAESVVLRGWDNQERKEGKLSLNSSFPANGQMHQSTVPAPLHHGAPCTSPSSPVGQSGAGTPAPRTPVASPKPPSSSPLQAAGSMVCNLPGMAVTLAVSQPHLPTLPLLLLLSSLVSFTGGLRSVRFE